MESGNVMWLGTLIWLVGIIVAMTNYSPVEYTIGLVFLIMSFFGGGILWGNALRSL